MGGSTTYRLAIGAFQTSDALDASIMDLFASGLTTRDLCLIGTRQAFQDIVHEPADYAFHERSALLRARPLKPLAVKAGDLELLATSGAAQRALLPEAGHNGRGLLLTGFVGSLDHVDELTQELRRHAIALLVSAPTLALQQRSSRILLRHSHHAVQTHEFTSSPPAP
jgi:hypothetical protein